MGNRHLYMWVWASQVAKNPPANAGGAGDMGSIPGSGRSPGGGNDNPLQYSCLDNPRGQRSLAGHSPRGCRVGTRLKQLSMHTWNMRLYMRIFNDTFKVKIPQVGPYVCLHTCQVHRTWTVRCSFPHEPPPWSPSGPRSRTLPPHPPRGSRLLASAREAGITHSGTWHEQVLWPGFLEPSFFHPPRCLWGTKRRPGSLGVAHHGWCVPGRSDMCTYYPVDGHLCSFHLFFYYDRSRRNILAHDFGGHADALLLCCPPRVDSWLKNRCQHRCPGCVPPTTFRQLTSMDFSTDTG